MKLKILGGVADFEQVQPVRVPVVDDVGEFAPLLLPAAAAARHPRRARRRGAEPGPGPGPGPLSRAPDGAGVPQSRPGRAGTGSPRGRCRLGRRGNAPGSCRRQRWAPADSGEGEKEKGEGRAGGGEEEEGCPESAAPAVSPGSAAPVAARLP